MKLRHELHQKLKAMMYEPVDELTLLNARLYAEQFVNEAYKRGEYFEDGFGKIEEKDLGIYSFNDLCRIGTYFYFYIRGIFQKFSKKIIFYMG